MAEKILKAFFRIEDNLKKVYPKVLASFSFFKKEILDDPTCFESTLERP